MGLLRKLWISLRASLIKLVFKPRKVKCALSAISNERGSQTIEFIGVLPLFLLMILILFQFTYAAITAVTAKQAAMEGARAAMVEDAGGAGFETAIRNTAGNFKISSMTKSEFASGTDTYVKIKVVLEAPLIMNKGWFDTSGLSLPITSEVTVRKEKKD